MKSGLLFLPSLPAITPHLDPHIMESVVLIFAIITGVGLGWVLIMFGLTLLIVVAMTLQGLAYNLIKALAMPVRAAVPIRTAGFSTRER